VTQFGKLFHIQAAATGKARSPTVERVECGRRSAMKTTWNAVADEPQHLPLDGRCDMCIVSQSVSQVCQAIFNNLPEEVRLISLDKHINF